MIETNAMCLLLFLKALQQCQLPLCIWSSDDAHISAGAPSVLQTLWYSHLADMEGIDGTQLSRLRLFSEQALCTLDQITVMQILFVGGSAVDPLRLPRGNRLKQYTSRRIAV